MIMERVDAILVAIISTSVFYFFELMLQIDLARSCSVVKLFRSENSYLESDLINSNGVEWSILFTIDRVELRKRLVAEGFFHANIVLTQYSHSSRVFLPPPGPHSPFKW